MQEIRMKDTRDEDGSGLVIVEIETRPGSDCWTTLNQTFFYKGTPIEVNIHHDDVKEINILQMTKPRYTWTKAQKFNRPQWNDRFYNFTQLVRKDTTPKKCKRDC